MSLFKKERFSIRKICGIVGSVLLGSVLVAPSVIHASTYHYVEKSALTKEEQSKIQAGIPTDNEASYALIYQQEALPATGSSTSVLTALGLLAVGSLVLLVHKNKKVASLFLVTTIGLISLSSMQALDISNPLKAPSNEGVVQIAGYRYIGYLPLNDDAISEIQHKAEGTKNVPVSEIQNVHNEAPKAEKPKNPESVSTVSNETTKSEKPEYTAPVGTVPDEAPKAEKPAYTEPVGTVPDEAPKAEKPEHTKPVGTVPDEAPKAEKPDYTQPIGTNLVEPAVQPALPEAVVTEKGEPEVYEKPAYTAPVGTVPDEAPKSEKPDYTQPIGANLVEPEVHEKPAYTKPVGTVPDEAPKAEKPAYTKPVGTVPDEAPKAEKPAYTKPVGTVPDVAPEREELPALHTDIRTETIPKTITEKSDSSKFIGDNSIKQVGEDGERQIVTSYEELHGKKISEPVETVTILKEMKPEILVKGTKEKPKEKTAPVLTLTTVSKDVLAKSATVNYNLENQDNATITSIVATIKEGGKIVKTVDLKTDNLSQVLENLDYYKDYTISTTMTYDVGKGAEVSTLEDKPLRLDLKKVELKDIANTSLIQVDQSGIESDSSYLTSLPSDFNNYYLKVTSRENKVTRLAIDKIEEVIEEGKQLYKITAKAPDLVQRDKDGKLRETYTYYLEKPRATEDKVYYNFHDLAKDMQANPTGDFKLGADLNAANVPTPNKQYVPGKFSGTLTSVDGKQYTIHNMARQLFDNVEGGTVKNINLGNVNINMPWIENISALSRVIKNATVENVKVTGSILGKDGIAGIVNKGDTGGLLKNVAFIGKLTGVGNKGWDLGGIAGELWRGNIKHAYVDADIVADRARVGGLVARTDNGSDPNGIDKYASVRNAVTKGTIDVKNPVEVGGFISKNWTWGRVADTVSMMKVKNGEEFYGSRDLEAEGGYYTKNWIERNYVVKDVSEGSHSFNGSRSNRIQEISLEDANKKIESFGITADKFEIKPLVEDALNNVKPKTDTYKDTQDYDASRELAYRNIEKLQPFYNKEWIVNQGNKIPAGSKLLTTEVLSVTGMKDGQFVTDLSNADHIMIHYADKTKEIKAITQKESKVQQVREYSIEGLGDVVYTPNMVVKDRANLINDIKAKLASVELDSDEVRKINNNPKMLYMEESFKEVKDNLDALVKALVENEDHQLNTDEAAKRALIKKVEDNKAKIMLALAYLNQYYGIKFDGLNIKNMMTFKPDFYGKNVNVLDRLISFASNGNNLKGDQSHDTFNRALASATGKANLHEFLKYNMELFTSETDMNTWFKNNIADNAYVVEKQSSNPDFANKKHKLYEVINNGHHGRYILPLLNLKKAHMILITTYNTIAFSSFEKYGKNTAEEREAFKKQVDLRAQEQINYLDFWSRLAADNVRNNLLKSENMVPSAIWDNHDVPGLGWVDRMGHTKKGDFAPIREFYGPTDKWHGYNGMGAYAYIFQNPQPQEAVYYIISSMISDFGTSAFTHETTHINDRMAYLGTWRHREGTDVEAFAQGMLQSPSVSNPNGEYGALGLNMAYERQNDGNQIYNYNPNVLNSREKIDHYMKNYNESMMMLDYLEAESVIKKNTGTNDKWFKKIDKKYREKADCNGLVGEPHQWDLVRDLNDDEKNTKLTSINQLVDGNFATKHGLPGNGHYRTEGFDSAYTVVNMMTGIYGGNTSKSAVGSISFKHNTFRMWGYFGYLDGFLGYASNKYKQESKAAGNVGLGDDFIINKVSNGKFQSLEAWKKAWYHEVHEKAQRGFVEIEIDGQKISTYAQLQTLFDAAVEKDLQGNDFKNTVDLKWKVYKQLLQKSDGFAGDLFTKA